LTKGTQKRIARIAFERMRREYETGFEFLSGFGTAKRFLTWIGTIDRSQQLNAALGVTCRQLKLRHIECESTPNFEQWANLYGSSPLELALDRTWSPKRRRNQVETLVSSSLGPVAWRGKQSVALGESNPLMIPQIRTALEINTKNADIVVLQFFEGDMSLFDISYVGLLGLGQTGWRLHNDQECAVAGVQLPLVIAKARELV
jgi:hypothetical protein